MTVDNESEVLVKGRVPQSNKVFNDVKDGGRKSAISFIEPAKVRSAINPLVTVLAKACQ